MYHHVGGSTPVFDEVIVSLSGLNKVISIDETSGMQIVFIAHVFMHSNRNSCL